MRIILVLLLLSASVASAAPSGTSALSGLPKVIAKDSYISVKAISLADGSVSKTKKFKKASNFSIKSPVELSLFSISYVSRISKTILVGKTKKVGGPSATKKALDRALKVKLKKPRVLARKVLRSERVSASANLSEKLRVGVPNDAITLSGTGSEDWMGRAQVQLLQTEIINGAACYDQSGGFVLIELDPDVMAARQLEFDLCKSGKADPATCVVDAYQAPTILVKGNLTVEGNAATLQLNLVTANGTVISQSSAIGSVKDISSWEALTKQAAASVVETLCSGGSIEVSEARCDTPACDFPCGSGTAIRQLPTIVGNASGPVGAIALVGFSRNFATIDCGAWSVEACSANVCCKRTSEAQPRETSFTAVLDLFNQACLCPSGSTVDYDVITQLRLGIPQEIERRITCPT